MPHSRPTRRAGGFVALVVASLLLVGFTQETPPRAGPDFRPLVVVQMAVSNLDRSLAFYGDVLGLELDVHVEQLRWAKFKTAIPGLTIGLSETEEVAGSGSVSLNLAVADADRARAMLEERGVVFLGETTNIPGVVRLADFKDPDGNTIRLAGPPK